MAVSGHQLYACLSIRADVLFELTDVILCAEGPVRSLVESSCSESIPEAMAGCMRV